MTGKEFEEDIKNAGFSKIKFFYLKTEYILSTKKWFKIDFKGDKSKYQKLNDYIRPIKNISGMEIKDLGEDGFEIKVPALISVAWK